MPPGASGCFWWLSPPRGLWLRSGELHLPSSFTLLPHQKSLVLSGVSDSVFLLWQGLCPPSLPWMLKLLSTMQPNSLPSYWPMSQLTAGNTGRESQRRQGKGRSPPGPAPLGRLWSFQSLWHLSLRPTPCRLQARLWNTSASLSSRTCSSTRGGPKRELMETGWDRVRTAFVVVAHRE